MRLNAILLYGAPASLMDKPKDIAVLVRDLSEAKARAWAERVAAGHHLNVTEGIEDGPFTELWFPSSSPWPDSSNLAHAVAEEFGREVLYEPPGSDPYDWRSVSPTGDESDVEWVEGPEPRAV